MPDFYIYYMESNIVCFVIFGIMLVHDLLRVDRQETQLKYDHALTAFMLYFLSDSIWAGVDSGFFPRNGFSVAATHFSNYVIMAAVTYFWLRYVMAVEGVPNREKPLNKIAVVFPFIISTLLLIIIYFVSPDTLIAEDLTVKPSFNIFLATVPFINIGAVLIYSLRKAKTEKNPVERSKYMFAGLFPLLVIAGGLVELLFFPHVPIYCFCCTALMLVFYIRSMDTQISTDPLTQLNNRGQLVRYISQESNLRQEGRATYVMMTDINYFKNVNDTYGHSEGDRALTLVAEALRGALGECGFPFFVARYGGDEFIIILHPETEDAVSALAAGIRARVAAVCEENKTPYKISVGIGCDRLLPSPDSFTQCQNRADHKLYLDKEMCKITSRMGEGR